MKSFGRWLLVGTVSLCDSAAIAQVGGGVTVRVPVAGVTAECVNSATDRVWLTLYRVITAKNAHFFSSENQAEIVLNVGVKTDPAAPQAISYPLSATVNISNYPRGQVSIPVEYTVISGLPLEQTISNGQTIVYTGFALDTTLVNIRSTNGLGSALEALMTVTGAGKLPIPNTPYTQAATYLLQFANDAVAKDIKTKNARDKFTTASLALNFDPEGQCTGVAAGGQGFEMTGVKAVVMATGLPGSGLIPLAQVGDYCWSADLSPAFVLKAALKNGATPCSDPSYTPQLRPITNDYLAFFLQKRRRSGTLGPMTPLAQRERDEALRICTALGVSPCLAAQ